MQAVSLDPSINKVLQEGTVIPAHPLALDENRQLDEMYQRALTRYYLAAGSGGVAVGVHSTQFEIRDPEHNLLESVLSMAAEEVDHIASQENRNIIKVAGILGPTEQAVKEARLARSLGYDLGLISMGHLPDWTEDELVARTKEVAKEIPIFGFYLQPAVGGRVLSFDFWRKFAAIENVYAIKVAAFNRYHTLDVVRAVCQSPRASEIALYTGNDDNIIADLLTPYRFDINGKPVEKHFVGGLLGHWAFWTKKAVELLHDIKAGAREDARKMQDLLARGIATTDANAAVFDANNGFHGCLAGINEVLRRQGLLPTNYCLNPKETLSPGQAEEIDRIYRDYSFLHDDVYVKEHLDEWLAKAASK